LVCAAGTSFHHHHQIEMASLDPPARNAYVKKGQQLQRRATDLQKRIEAEQQIKEQQELREKVCCFCAGPPSPPPAARVVLLLLPACWNLLFCPLCSPPASMLQVLTDLCQLTEGLQRLQRAKQQASTADRSSPAPDDAAEDAQQQQNLAAALAAVPQYCCSADLMQKATPELLQLVLSFTEQDISRLYVNTFTEVLTLVELSSRPAAAAPPAPAAEGGLDSAQGPAHPTPQGELQRAIDRFFGVVLLAFACQPMPLFKAACINHRTGQEVDPPAHHWIVSQSVGMAGTSQHGRLSARPAGQLSHFKQLASLLHKTACVQDMTCCLCAVCCMLCAGCDATCCPVSTAKHVP
jgi:hypothetical protein